VPYSVTNLGILLETTLEPVQVRSDEEMCVAPLKDVTNGRGTVGILLKRLVPSSNQLARVGPHLVRLYKPSPDSKGQVEKIYVKQNQAIPRTYFSSSIYGFRIISATTWGGNGPTSLSADLKVRRVWPASQWSQHQLLLRAHPGTLNTLAAIWFDQFEDLVLLISFDAATCEKRFQFVRSIHVSSEGKELDTAVRNALVGVQELKSFERGLVSVKFPIYYKETAADVRVVANVWEDRVVLELSIVIYRLGR